MAGKLIGTFDEKGIEELANDKPVVYIIQDNEGEFLYIGMAKRGRVVARLKEHLPGGPDPIIGGARVFVLQKSSIEEAEKAEAVMIKTHQPPQNKRGK